MTRSKNGIHEAPLSIRRPEALDNAEEPLDKKGHVKLSRSALFQAFDGDPEKLRRLGPLFQLEEGEETIPISSKPELQEEE